MHPTCLVVSTIQAGNGGVMPIQHHLNATGDLSIVADHLYHFMATISPFYNGYFQHDNAPCHKSQIISNWCHDMTFGQQLKGTQDVS